MKVIIQVRFKVCFLFSVLILVGCAQKKPSKTEDFSVQDSLEILPIIIDSIRSEMENQWFYSKLEEYACYSPVENKFPIGILVKNRKIVVFDSLVIHDINQISDIIANYYVELESGENKASFYLKSITWKNEQRKIINNLETSLQLAKSQKST